MASQEAGKVTAPRAARQRPGEIVFVIVLALLVAAAAYFREEIQYFIQLQAWNPGQPAHTVASFLQAGRAGNARESDRYVDPNLFHPLEENGRFVGYQMGMPPIGNIEYRFSELAGPGEIRATHSELVFKGRGAAMVTVPDASGHPIVYRLEMQGGSWKITEIRGGRLRR
jgi:hypothetical protein